METKINEIANDIYRALDVRPGNRAASRPHLQPVPRPWRRTIIVPHRSPADVPFIRTALSRILPPERLRWITFGHYEADECGAMNEASAVAPQAKVAHGQTGCLVSLNDMADRTPQVLQDGQVIDLGKGKRVRYIDTPHIPHGWDAGVLYEETSRTLLCGDLFTQLGDGPALTESDVVGPAIAAEDIFQYSSLNPGMGTTIRRLAELSPRTLALMHGPSFSGDGATCTPRPG